MNTIEGQDLGVYDVVVVGGGAAGLSGALMLELARRTVLVVDAGEPRNAPASAVHGFLTRDGMEPAALLQAGRDEGRRYGARVLDGRVESATSEESGFTVTLEDGSRVGARRLLITTGFIDELPDVPGVRECWGRDVLHCSYCHGWEFRDQPIGILASGPMSVHQALLFRQWSEDAKLFLHTAPQPTGEEAEQLAAREITIVEGEIASLEIAGDRLTGVRMGSGEVIPRRAMAIMPRSVVQSGVLSGLGLKVSAHPMGVGEHVDADASGLTAVPGVWVAGNVTDPAAQVLGAANAGAMAAGATNADLVAEDTDRAAAYRARREARTAGQH